MTNDKAKAFCYKNWEFADKVHEADWNAISAIIISNTLLRSALEGPFEWVSHKERVLVTIDKGQAIAEYSGEKYKCAWRIGDDNEVIILKEWKKHEN